MSNLKIDPKLIEIATKALHESEGIAFAWEDMNETDRSLSLLHMEAAIRAIFEELGLRKERRADYMKNNRLLSRHKVAPIEKGWEKTNEEVRFISDWKEVIEPS